LMNRPDTTAGSSGSRLRRPLVIGCLILLAVVLLVTVWVRHNLYASRFSPVSLGQEEQEVLEAKLALLREKEPVPEKPSDRSGKPLSPEPYSEEGASREIALTERELNALIANTPDVAEAVAVDLSDDLISVTLVLPVDEEVPVLGGKRLRIRMGLTVLYEGGDPSIAIKGVSLGGIPVPNAWLGNLKNVNLLGEFGTGDGFWEIFSAGVRTIRVREGHLRITLKE
jgi:hypothetical protein